MIKEFRFHKATNLEKQLYVSPGAQLIYEGYQNMLNGGDYCLSSIKHGQIIMLSLLRVMKEGIPVWG
jgi:hypothetical protein